MGFEQWDSINEDKPTGIVAALDSFTPVLANGFHTLALPDGSHRTFRVHTQNAKAKFAPGRRIISILIGPENTSDYEKFGWVDESGIKVWKRWQGKKQEEYATVIWKIAGGEVIEGYDLHTSQRCLVCNRELTTVESISRGIGPECWAKTQGTRS